MPTGVYIHKPTTLGMRWKLSSESKKKQSEAQKKRFKEKPLSEESRKLIGEKVSKTLKGRKRVFTQEWIENLRRANKNKILPTGENHWSYIKDRSKLKQYKSRRSTVYHEWRMGVLNRDKYTCRIADNKCNGELETHHILNWVDYPELRYQINNGITLCHAHHPRKWAEEKRLIPTFQELVSVSSN